MNTRHRATKGMQVLATATLAAAFGVFAVRAARADDSASLAEGDGRLYLGAEIDHGDLRQ